jgi:hypothetical protein
MKTVIYMIASILLIGCSEQSSNESTKNFVKFECYSKYLIGPSSKGDGYVGYAKLPIEIIGTQEQANNIAQKEAMKSILKKHNAKPTSGSLNMKCKKI